MLEPVTDPPEDDQPCDESFFDYYVHAEDDPCPVCGKDMGDHPSGRG
jgi:hypothetical protein